MTGGVVAIALGALMIVSAVRTNPNIRRNTEPGFLLFAGTSNRIPLILFGLGTTIAWTITGRAIFRIVCFESTSFLTNGIQQKDLSKIFGTYVLSRSWWAWRMRLWRSSLFGVLCLLLYGIVALSYRYALTDSTRDISRSLNDLEDGISPITGCHGNGSVIHEYAGIRGMVSSSRTAQFTHRTYEPNGWFNVFGWGPLSIGEPWELSEPSSPVNIDYSVELEVTGPFLVVMSKWIGSNRTIYSSLAPQKSRSDYLITVSDSGDCGPLLVSCDTDPYCLLLGLGYGNFSMQYPSMPRSDGRYVYPKSGHINSPDQPTTQNCPIGIDKQLYFDIVKELNGYFEFDQVDLASYLIARIGVNQSAILEQEDATNLRAFGILAPEDGNCSSVYTDLLVENLYQGKKTYVLYQQFNPTPHYIASACLIIWGVSLLIVGMPLKSLVVSGTID
jgi:hypothetical protein